MKNKPSVVVGLDMKLPSLTDPQGLFDIVIGLIVFLAGIALAYLLLFGTF